MREKDVGFIAFYLLLCFIYWSVLFVVLLILVICMCAGNIDEGEGKGGAKDGDGKRERDGKKERKRKKEVAREMEREIEK